MAVCFLKHTPSAAALQLGQPHHIQPHAPANGDWKLWSCITSQLWLG